MVNALRSYGILIAGAVVAVVGVVLLLGQSQPTEWAFQTVDATGPAGKQPGTEPDPTLGIVVTAIGALAVVGWVVARLIRRNRPAVAAE